MAEKVVQPAIPESQSTRIEDIRSYVNVRTLSAYDFVDATYNGSCGYRDGTYLIPHPREAFYNTRRRSSYYINAYKPVVNAMVNPVFKNVAVRETDSEAFRQFIDNCDNAGTPLQAMVKNAMTKARRSGVCFLVMDNMTREELASAVTEDQAIAHRALPYAYLKRAQDMHEIECDKYGKIASISLYDGIEKIDKQEYARYRRWDSSSWVTYYEEGIGESMKRVETGRGDHGLGVVPVITINPFAEIQGLSSMPEPPMYDLAFLSFALFNKESLVVTLEQNQSFSILYVSGIDRKSITAGPTNFLSVGDTAKFPPGFASPDAAHIKNLVENCNRLEDRIRSLAQQNGVIGVVKQSGIAKEWDFRAEEGVLQETALAATNLEYAMHKIFDLYRNKTTTYSVKYPTKFSPTYANERIAQCLDVLDRVPPPPVCDELWVEISETIWAQEEDRLQIVKDSLDLAAESQRQSTAEGNGIAALKADNATTGAMQ